MLLVLLSFSHLRLLFSCPPEHERNGQKKHQNEICEQHDTTQEMFQFDENDEELKENGIKASHFFSFNFSVCVEKLRPVVYDKYAGREFPVVHAPHHVSTRIHSKALTAHTHTPGTTHFLINPIYVRA